MSAAETAIEALLEALAVPPSPELDGTPRRVARMWRDNLLGGYRDDPAELLAETIPAGPDAGVVTLTHLPLHGMCPHHLLPFVGVAHVAYAPGAHIVGLGAVEGLVRALSRRLVLQETLGAQIADALMVHLGALGAACAIEAQHLCLSLRGREPHRARVCTRVARGTLADRPEVLPAVSGVAS